MRVLSLICSATGAKEIGAHLIKSILRNKKRNCLEQQRLNVLGCQTHYYVFLSLIGPRTLNVKVDKGKTTIIDENESEEIVGDV